MNGFGQFFRRFGSFVLAILVPVLALFVEGPLQYLGVFYEITRAAASGICIALLIHSWLRQRRHSRSAWELLAWTTVLSVPLLGAVWLGLNVIRSYVYPLYWRDEEIARWALVCRIQHWVEFAGLSMAIVAAVLIGSLALAKLFMWSRVGRIKAGE
jgi:hypothetical protein